MQKQLYWEEIEEGQEITPLSKVATTQMLVKWAGATGDFNPVHYDSSFADSQGLAKPIVHGQLKRAWMVQMLVDYIGAGGTLRKLSCQFRAIDYPRSMGSMTAPHEGETWWCKGVITKKYEAGGENWADCDIWVENGKGEKTTVGNAGFTLPLRGGVTS